MRGMVFQQGTCLEDFEFRTGHGCVNVFLWIGKEGRREGGKGA
jgi:hypothetical protein